MHRFDWFGEEFFDIARRLADAVFVFYQCNADITFPIFAEPDAGRYCYVGFSRRSLENSSEPISAYFSGTGAQANIVAGGAGIGHPARVSESTRQSRRDW